MFVSGGCDARGRRGVLVVVLECVGGRQWGGQARFLYDSGDAATTACLPVDEQIADCTNQKRRVKEQSAIGTLSQCGAGRERDGGAVGNEAHGRRIRRK